MPTQSKEYSDWNRDSSVCYCIFVYASCYEASIASAKSMCCGCKRKEVKRKEVCGQWLCAICVMSFVILFIVGDIDWFWNFFTNKADTAVLTLPIPKIIRLFALSFAFLALDILMVVYIVVRQ